MTDNGFDNVGKEMPPFHHESEDMLSACGIDRDRMHEAGKKVTDKMFHEGDEACTSKVVESIEALAAEYNIREIIVLALALGMAKGTFDSPKVLASMIQHIREEKGEEGFDFNMPF